MAGFEVECPSCSKSISYAASKCDGCGYRITQADVDARRTKGNSDSEGIAYLVIIVAFIAFVGWFFFLRDPKPDELARKEATRQSVAEDVARLREEQVRTKAACDAGQRSACVEYAKMID